MASKPILTFSTIELHESPESFLTSMAAPRLASALLALYILCETIRANYAYHVFHTFPSTSPSVIALLSECLKLLVAIIILLFLQLRDSRTQNPKWRDIGWRTIVSYAVPASLYLTNNLIYMTVLPLTSPSLMQVCVLAKLPATAILYHFAIKRQRNVFAWTSLLLLCFGLLVFNIPSGSSSKSQQHSSWFLAPIAGGIIAVLSACASISSEVLIKKGDFWVSQFYLYVWGAVLALLSLPIVEALSTHKNSPHKVETAVGEEAIISISMLVVITAGTGMVVACLFRFKDNILKLIGTSAALVTVVVTQYIVSPELRASTFTPAKVCGGGIVAVSTWCYNHWNAQSSERPTNRRDESERGEYIQLGRDDIVGIKHPEPKTRFYEPDATKIICSALIIAFLTLETSEMTAK